MKKILVVDDEALLVKGIRFNLQNEGYEVVVYDNLYNSSEESIKRVEELTGKTVKFYEGDILDADFLKTMFEMEKIDAVIHFAGLKAVGESVAMPLEYYRNNLLSLITLLEQMQAHNVHHIVFSSSCTVYGQPSEEHLPVDKTVEQAAELDDKLIAAWTGHPHLRIIDNAEGFEEKLKKLTEKYTYKI